MQRAPVDGDPAGAHAQKTAKIDDSGSDLASPINDNVDNAPHVVAGRAEALRCRERSQAAPRRRQWPARPSSLLWLVVILRRWRGGVWLRGRRGGGDGGAGAAAFGCGEGGEVAGCWDGVGTVGWGDDVACADRQGNCAGLRVRGDRRLLRREQHKSDEGQLLLVAASAAKDTLRRGAERRHGLRPFIFCRQGRPTQALQTRDPVSITHGHWRPWQHGALVTVRLRIRFARSMAGTDASWSGPLQHAAESEIAGRSSARRDARFTDDRCHQR